MKSTAVIAFRQNLAAAREAVDNARQYLGDMARTGDGNYNVTHSDVIEAQLRGIDYQLYCAAFAVAGDTEAPIDVSEAPR